VIRACTRATLVRALARFAEPLSFLARFRWARASAARSRRSCLGLVIFSPVERVSRLSSPASIPTEPDAGACSIRSSQSRDTNHRPALSRDTVTVEGAAPSGSGRDHTMVRGSAIFARVSRPSRQRNALVVYSADRRERFLLLNVGYLARLVQKFVNAPCRCRNACWSGTEETSLRNASSSVVFQPVSSAEVAL
jgi:hypothetical protein